MIRGPFRLDSRWLTCDADEPRLIVQPAMRTNMVRTRTHLVRAPPGAKEKREKRVIMAETSHQCDRLYSQSQQ